MPFSGSDCGACATGYAGYPDCIKMCDKGIDCNGNANDVLKLANGSCQCTCRNSWTGYDSTTAATLSAVVLTAVTVSKLSETIPLALAYDPCVMEMAW
jgi:hypothetical protein